MAINMHHLTVIERQYIKYVDLYAYFDIKFIELYIQFCVSFICAGL